MLLTSRQHFQFYSCNFLLHELLRHRNKLLKLTKCSEPELIELERLITKNITFINEAIIPERMLIASEKLLHDIDPDDVPFVALAKQLKAKLWTGDKVLIKGLKAKRFRGIITTPDLHTLFEKLERG